MNQTTKIQVQTTIATVMTTAALITTQPIVTTAAETTTHAILPGYVTQYGDVNLDQEVSVMDVLMLQRYMLGLPAEIENWKNADLDKDGVIDIYDLAILKRGLTHNMEGIGGTMRVKLVDPATGEAPDTNAHVRLICRYQESDEVNDLFRVAEFDYTPGDIWEIRGLATGSAYLYELSIRDLEGGYGDQNGNWHRTLQATFDDETEMDLTLEVGEETPNVEFKEYDWALGSGTDDWLKQYYVMDYGAPVVTDQNGTKYEHSIYGSHWFKLPDGNYHAEWKLPQSNALVQLVDPESDFAKEIMAENPDVVFTDQSKGIDFTIKNGKPDKPLQFDFMPVEGINNQLTVNCIDSLTGEPVEGAKLSLILDPKGERETVESWTSDETGSRHFENLKISGYPSYMVQVDEMPEGYSSSFDTKTTTAYWTYISEGSGDSQEITLKFVPDAAEKNVSINLLNWEDKSLLNDLATYVS
ncbi:MAG: dockerin type I repeat-containing protein [Oscillospiraceae bacterium]|nr:dockerin type I repeat-containing protein [Oscillospiraceae bacterium]